MVSEIRFLLPDSLSRLELNCWRGWLCNYCKFVFWALVLWIAETSKCWNLQIGLFEIGLGGLSPNLEAISPTLFWGVTKDNFARFQRNWKIQSFQEIPDILPVQNQGSTRTPKLLSTVPYSPCILETVLRWKKLDSSSFLSLISSMPFK